MLFNFFCLLLIVLIALYLATQGLLSAMLALVTATFSSILAMGLMEFLDGYVASYAPDSARGLTFLGLFLVTFAVTRVVADMLVPENIKLPMLVNRIAGGSVGFFAALVIMGTTLNGIDMLPLGTSLMGYDRFPGETRMQNDDIAGVAAAPSNIWFAPERVTLAIWNGASGRSLGGAKPFASVHPDLSVESYGYRNTVVYASNHTLANDLLAVKTGWESADSKVYEPLGIKVNEPGKKIVMVRTDVQRGGGKKSPDSGDADGTYFRITPTEVRLVTDKAHQYYPIGYLDKGTSFVKLPLDTGTLVEDYAKSGSVVEDWIFQINDDEKAQFIEVKELARAGLSGVIKNSPVPALAAGAYPAKAYQKEAATLTVTMTAPDPIREGNVYIIRPNIMRSDADAQITAGYNHSLEVITDTTGSWTDEGKPGVPGKQIFRLAQRLGINLQNKGQNDTIDTDQALQILMTAPFTLDGSRNLIEVPQFVTDTVIPMVNKFVGARGLIGSATVGSSGKVTIPNVPPGLQVFLVTLRTEKGFYYWIARQVIEPRGTPSMTFDAKSAVAAVVP